MMSLRVFDDFSRTGEFALVEPLVESGKYLVFNDLGNEILEEGIDGGRIEVIIPTEEPVTAKGFGSVCIPGSC